MTTNPKQGEIWYVNLDPTKGTEKGKIRPVVVISNNLFAKSNIRIVVPITKYDLDHENYIWMIKIMPDKINNLVKPSTIDCMHLRAVDKVRFTNYFGNISQPIINDIKSVISFII